MVDSTSKMQLLYVEGNKLLYEYTPTLFSPLYPKFEKIKFVRRIRLMLEYLKAGRYKVYYYAINNELVGCISVVPGGRSLNMCSKKDICLEFLYIDPQYRGRGYSKEIINLTNITV